MLHHPQELLPCEGSGNSRIEILLDGRFPCGRSVLLGQPQGIRTGYPFRFLCTDDGKAVLYTQFVRNPSHPSYIAFLIAAVLFPGFHGDRVPHNVVMDAFGVEMGADYRLKCHSAAYPQIPARSGAPVPAGDFSKGKTLHQMKSLHAPFSLCHIFLTRHISSKARVSQVQPRADANRSCSVFSWLRAFPISLSSDFSFSLREHFLLVKGVVDGVVKAVDGDNAGVGNSGFLLSQFLGAGSLG